MIQHWVIVLTFWSLSMKYVRTHNQDINQTSKAIGSEEPKPRLPTEPCVRVTYTAPHIKRDG